MKLLTEALSEIVKSTFEACGYDEKLGFVTVSDRLDLCQFQCNGAFAGAKLYKKSPLVIAQEIAAQLLNHEMIEKAEAAAPGFINITLKDSHLSQTVNEISKDDDLGIPQGDKSETIVLDYGNPNVAKPLHIGHLRSAIIGEALKRLTIATGRQAVGDVHLGDWGTPMGLVIAELCERYEKIPTLTAELLNEIYPFASKRSKEDPEFLAKARDITAKLQNGDETYTAIWREMIKVSIEDMKKIYSRLGVEFDYWYGESDADKYIPQLLDTLKSQNLLYESEGALVVDVALEGEKAPMPPVIIKKSDNSSIYATTDLATIIQRKIDFYPKKIWYVVDHRQSLHFTQVFRCAKKSGLVSDETELTHIGFGTMNGTDGKPYKTRDGGVMQLSVLLDTVTQTALQRIKNSAFADEAERLEVAEKIGLAAVKFGDLINHHAKDYIFDMDKFLSAEGKTGVYLLYTIARINSIIRKAELSSDKMDIYGIYSDSERELALKIILSGEAFNSAFNEKAINIICENAYQIAVAFSKFYHDNHILGEADETKKNSWLGLCLLTQKVLTKHLYVLGIEAVEVM